MWLGKEFLWQPSSSSWLHSLTETLVFLLFLDPVSVDVPSRSAAAREVEAIGLRGDEDDRDSHPSFTAVHAFSKEGDAVFFSSF